MLPLLRGVKRHEQEEFYSDCHRVCGFCDIVHRNNHHGECDNRSMLYSDAMSLLFKGDRKGVGTSDKHERFHKEN